MHLIFNYNDIIELIYPVGSIYITTNNVNPGTIFTDTTWEAYGSSDTYLRLGGDGSGGSNTYSLTSANIPAHTHSVGAHSHGLNSHTHGVGSYSAASKSLTGSVVHSDNICLNTGAGETMKSVSGIVSMSTGTKAQCVVGASVDTRARKIGFTIDATHAHSVSGTSGAASGSTANSSAFDSGSYGSSTVTAVSITPKYVQVYAWKRTA